MKKQILLLLAYVTVFTAFTQNINIPNYNFVSNLNGWTITGNNISMVNSSTDYTSGILFVVNPTYNDEVFTIQSSQFPLFANDNYVFFTEYGYYIFDEMTGASQLGQLSSVVLKNSSGIVVQTFNLNCNVTGNGPGQMDLCESSPFLIDTTDNYYLELTGTVNHTDPASYTDAAYNFGQIDLYKDNSPHTIYGNVSYDENNDNCVTSSYTPSNISVKSTSSTGNVYFSNTNSTGNYGFSFDESGSVTTEIANGIISSSPTNYINTFVSGTPQNSTNQDFCITSTILGADVEVIIIPTSEARPGFNSAYTIRYTNNGNTTANGSIDFTYDTNLVNHLSSLPTENTSTSNTLTWNYSTLAPFETREIKVFFNINTPPTVNNGDILPFSALINPTLDADPTNNISYLQQTTIGSYDPNDAIIFQGPKISLSQTQDDLYFRIRFQNTGTASAININVDTVLDANLDLSTFTPISASHNFSTTITGNNVNFKFNNINLADSTSNEPSSHGYVVFKATPKNTVVIGDVFNVSAAIYFDYNTAIVTNTYTTTITSETYVPDDNFENYLETHDANGNTVALGDATSMGNGIANDDYVTTSNINTVTVLNVISQNITNLTGIEEFTALQFLYCGSNQLTTLNVDQLLNLEMLNCSSNQLTSMDVSNNLFLEILDISNNQFSSLNVTMLNSLQNLKISGNTFSNIDISQNLGLYSFDCRFNQIQNIDVSQHVYLQVLRCSYNQLETLNVKNGNNTNFTLIHAFLADNNPNLTCIEVDDVTYSTTNWTIIDATASFSLNCHFNETYVPDDNFETYLETHDANGNTVTLGDAMSMGNGIANDDYVTTSSINTVINLNVNNQNIADLTGIADFNSLLYFICYANQLSSIDLSQNTNLISIICQGNNLTSLDVSQNLALTSLDCRANQINSLDLSLNTNLTSLNCQNNQLTTLIVKNGNNSNMPGYNFYTTNNPNLTCIEVDDIAYSTNSWTNIDSWTGFSTLCYLAMVPDDNFETYLETHDANGNIVPLGDPTSMGNGIMLDDYVTIANILNVTMLNIHNLNIQNIIGIEYFSSLTNLNCHSNAISNIDISQNTSLTVFSCAFNQLSSIDVSSNSNLFHLNVRDNNLNNIDIAQNSALTFFNCASNQINNLDVTQNNLLTFLGINDNLISTIDITQNLNLVTFMSGNNQLSNLDLSNHTNLEQFDCEYNQLTSLNVKNGNNVNFSIFYATDNPNLTCIIVDDATWSDTHWSNFKDASSTFANNQAECTLSVDGETLQNISIYPNPATNKLYVVSEEKKMSYKLFSITGTLILKGKINQTSQAIDVSKMNKGVYFINLIMNNKNVTRKILIK